MEAPRQHRVVPSSEYFGIGGNDVGMRDSERQNTGDFSNFTEVLDTSGGIGLIYLQV